MGFGSPIHWIVVLAIVFLLFGNRLPSVMRSLGQGVTEFKKGLEGKPDEDDDGDEVVEKPKKKKVAEIEEKTEAKSNGAETTVREKETVEEK